MPDTKQEIRCNAEAEGPATCQAQATFMVGRFTDADVECCLEAGHDPDTTAHVAKQTVVATVDKKSQEGIITYTWR